MSTNLCCKIEAVQTLNIVNEPLRELLDHILADSGSHRIGDQQIIAQGRWAIATDGVQWILQRRRGDRWQNLSFVRTTRDILARCMREKGASAGEMTFLAGLPDRFQEASQTDKNMCSVRCGGGAS